MSHWMFHGKDYAACRAAAMAASVEDLARIAIDDIYNQFVAEHADLDERSEGSVGPVPKMLVDNTHGKLVPYIGWYWRATRWFDGRIMIGDCGEFIGVIENNKWGYPQRYTTPEEFAQVVAIVDEALAESRKGGEIEARDRAIKAALAKLWPLFQTFKIEEHVEP